MDEATMFDSLTRVLDWLCRFELTLILVTRSRNVYLCLLSAKSLAYCHALGLGRCWSAIISQQGKRCICPLCGVHMLSQLAFAIGCWPKHPPRVAIRSKLDLYCTGWGSSLLTELKRLVKASNERFLKELLP